MSEELWQNSEGKPRYSYPQGAHLAAEKAIEDPHQKKEKADSTRHPQEVRVF